MEVSRPLVIESWAVELGIYCSNYYEKISAVPLKISSLTGDKNDLMNCFMQHVRNGLIIILYIRQIV